MHVADQPQEAPSSHSGCRQSTDTVGGGVLQSTAGDPREAPGDSSIAIHHEQQQEEEEMEVSVEVVEGVQSSQAHCSQDESAMIVTLSSQPSHAHGTTTEAAETMSSASGTCRGGGGESGEGVTSLPETPLSSPTCSTQLPNDNSEAMPAKQTRVQIIENVVSESSESSEPVALDQATISASPEEASPKDRSSEEASPKDSSSEEASPKDSSSEEASPKDSSSEEASPKDSSSEEASPKDSSSEEASFKDGSLEQSSFKDGSLEEASPKDGNSEEASMKDSSSEEASFKGGSSEEANPKDGSTDTTEMDLAETRAEVQQRQAVEEEEEGIGEDGAEEVLGVDAACSAAVEAAESNKSGEGNKENGKEAVTDGDLGKDDPAVKLSKETLQTAVEEHAEATEPATSEDGMSEAEPQSERGQCDSSVKQDSTMEKQQQVAEKESVSLQSTSEAAAVDVDTSPVHTKRELLALPRTPTNELQPNENLVSPKTTPGGILKHTSQFDTPTSSSGRGRRVQFASSPVVFQPTKGGVESFKTPKHCTWSGMNLSAHFVSH